MAKIEGKHGLPSHWQAIFVFVLSVAFAVGATVLLASYAGSADWCCVHPWAMAHGTGLVVLLLFGLLGFHLVRAVGERLGLLVPTARSNWLPHVAYVCGSLGTFVLTEHFMWVGLVAGGATVWQRARGRAVRPFGLAIIGLLVSVLDAAYWIYTGRGSGLRRMVAKRPSSSTKVTALAVRGIQSCRSATTGSILAARRAGR